MQGFGGRAGLQVVVTADRAACAVLCRALPENVPSPALVQLLLFVGITHFDCMFYAGNPFADFLRLSAQHQDISGTMEAQRGNTHGQSLHQLLSAHPCSTRTLLVLSCLLRLALTVLHLLPPPIRAAFSCILSCSSHLICAKSSLAQHCIQPAPSQYSLPTRLSSSQ